MGENFPYKWWEYTRVGIPYAGIVRGEEIPPTSGIVSDSSNSLLRNKQYASFFGQAYVLVINRNIIVG